jgi:hypothetical protein
MAAPTAPYTDSATVAALSGPDMRGGADFSESTVPPKTTVDNFITLVSSQIDMHLAMAGYVIPLAEISGENWPVHQTSYLKLVATFGAAALTFGFSRKPAPAVSPSRGNTTGNVYHDLYVAEINKIFEPTKQISMTRLRADYIVGTQADKNLTVPIGPMTDFMEGKLDPMRELTQQDVIKLMWKAQDHIGRYEEPKWDYLYGLFGINKGVGQLYNERFPI